MSKRSRKEQASDREDQGQNIGITLDQLHEKAKRRKKEREEITAENKCNEEACQQEDISDDLVNEETEVNIKDIQKTEEEEGLTVLTQHESKGRARPVQYQLPNWVTQYCPIQEDIASNSMPLTAFNIHSRIRFNLQLMGISSLFPVQATVIPDLIDSARGPLLIHANGMPPSDICICAPTGCGKTLAYVIPIVHALLTSVNTCKLRALVVLPSQDLALQVKSVFASVCKGTVVKVGILCGQKTLDEEIESIVNPLGSKVDVLVCTPGRLVSHLQMCDLLTLSDLRYLVIDEADRIFEQHYHNWLDSVVEAIRRSSQIDSTSALFASSSVPFLFPSLFKALPKLGTTQTSSVQSSFFSTPTNISQLFSPRQPLQKLLFSATLSLDPEKLSLLRLYKPKLYSVSPVTGENIGEAVLPSTLSEYMLVCKSDHKPLYLLHVLRVLEKDNQILCFTHSKFSTHRLKLVLQQYEVSVEEVSASVSQEARKSIVKRFVSGKLKVYETLISLYFMDRFYQESSKCLSLRC